MMVTIDIILSLALGAVIAWQVKSSLVKRHIKMQHEERLERLHQRQFKIVGLTPDDDVVENIPENNMEHRSRK